MLEKAGGLHSFMGWDRALLTVSTRSKWAAVDSCTSFRIVEGSRWCLCFNWLKSQRFVGLFLQSKLCAHSGGGITP